MPLQNSMHQNGKTILSCFMAIGLLAGICLSSCNSPDPPEVEITVVDSLGKAVAGATVRITSKTYNAASNVEDVKTTDFKGKTYHSFKWEAILEVRASKSNLSGREFIQLELDKVIEKTVTIK